MISPTRSNSSKSTRNSNKTDCRSTLSPITGFF